MAVFFLPVLPILPWAALKFRLAFGLSDDAPRIIEDEKELKKRRLEKSKETEESKKIKKDEKLLNTYMREERKLFLGGEYGPSKLCCSSKLVVGLWFYIASSLGTDRVHRCEQNQGFRMLSCNIAESSVSFVLSSLMFIYTVGIYIIYWYMNSILKETKNYLLSSRFEKIFS